MWFRIRRGCGKLDVCSIGNTLALVDNWGLKFEREKPKRKMETQNAKGV